MILFAKFIVFIVFIIIIMNVFVNQAFSIDTNEKVSNNPTSNTLIPNCDLKPNVQSKKNFLVVTTVDGKISFIDAIEGVIKWTKNLQQEPLISSTIGDSMNIHNEKGEPIQILPSLDGNIYVFHDNTIKKTQFSAEKLLKSSVKFDDNTLLVGGIESKIIGLNINNGAIVYDCGHNGCNNENESIGQDVLLLRKNSQSVRAINAMTGHEIWHFKTDDPDLFKVQARSECHFDESSSTSPLKINFKVSQSIGRITGIVHFTNDSIQSEVTDNWHLSMKSPIVNMWHLEDNLELKKIDLFDPDINDIIIKNPAIDSLSRPILYLGSYQNHYYIQALPPSENDGPSSSKNNEIVPYKSNDKRRQAFIPLEEDNSGSNKKNNRTKRINNTGIIETNVKFLPNKSNNATGYLVLQLNETNDDEDHDICTTSIINNNEVEDENINGNVQLTIFDKIRLFIQVEIIDTPIAYTWKGLLFLLVVVTPLVNAAWGQLHKMYPQYIPRVYEFPLDDEDEIEEQQQQQEKSKEYECEERQQRKSECDNYVSRYIEDFEQVRLLGKGGFGMVFEAKHKFDQSHYAVKRITIPATIEKRKHFMREIRALSRLDHVNIVRYYHSWIEEPPFGWQEEQDKLNNYDLTISYDFPTETSEISSIQENNNNNNHKNHLLNRVGSTASFNKQEEDSLLTNDDYDYDDNDDDSVEIVFDKDCSISEGIKHEFVNKDDDNVNQQTRQLNRKQEEKVFDSKVYQKLGYSTIEKKKKKNPIGKAPINKAFIYIQMQLCKKETLKEWLLENQQRDLAQMIDIFVQLLKAVKYVHSNNMVHRDLKPSNIFFSMDGLIKIGDFGLVTEIVEDDEDHVDGSSNHNSPIMKRKHQHTKLVGTQLYMSPEQIKNRTYDHKVDIYSMGIILYELLMPFKTESERIHQLQNVRRKIFPETFQNEYPIKKKIIERMMADEPKDRPESFEILHEIESNPINLKNEIVK